MYKYKIFLMQKNVTKLNRIMSSLKYFENKFFLVTYGDGLANINFHKQLAYFKNKKINNVVSVFKIRSQYGHVNIQKN